MILQALRDGKFIEVDTLSLTYRNCGLSISMHAWSLVTARILVAQAPTAQSPG